MIDNFQQLSPFELESNIFKLIDKDWFLLTAGVTGHFNTMTASWGGMGILWHKPICIVFVRPSRYTWQFMENTDVFTISFFEDKYRKALDICGSTTGKRVDKMRETGLVPMQLEHGGIAYEQSRLVIECSKIYFDDLKLEHFLDKNIEKNYPLKDYHRMYIGEILGLYHRK
jgi:flavin reductase (DIM6/NTAB) family NADH-FMN oxidoreductase RutF